MGKYHHNFFLSLRFFAYFFPFALFRKVKLMFLKIVDIVYILLFNSYWADIKHKFLEKISLTIEFECILILNHNDSMLAPIIMQLLVTR